MAPVGYKTIAFARSAEALKRVIPSLPTLAPGTKGLIEIKMRSSLIAKPCDFPGAEIPWRVLEKDGVKIRDVYADGDTCFVAFDVGTVQSLETPDRGPAFTKALLPNEPSVGVAIVITTGLLIAIAGVLIALGFLLISIRVLVFGETGLPDLPDLGIGGLALVIGGILLIGVANDGTKKRR